jgi:CheY-like chemotaxis protein
MKNILIVDDNLDGALSLKLFLELLGYSASLAHSGQEALDAIHTEMPQLVFLDIGLPDITGYEVAQKIRSMPGGDAPQIVAITGWGSEEVKQKSRKAGCDLHLTKPIDLNEVENVLAA